MWQFGGGWRAKRSRLGKGDVREKFTVESRRRSRREVRQDSRIDTVWKYTELAKPPLAVMSAEGQNRTLSTDYAKIRASKLVLLKSASTGL